VAGLSVDRVGAQWWDTAALTSDSFNQIVQQTKTTNQNPGDIDPVWVGNQVKSYMQAGNYDRAVQFVLDYAKTTIDPLDYARTVSDADFNKMLSQFPVSTLLAHAGANKADLLKAIVQKGDTSQITALTQQMQDDPLLARTMAQYGTSANKVAYVQAIAQSPGSNTSLDNAALVISTLQGPDAATAIDSFSPDQIQTMVNDSGHIMGLDNKPIVGGIINAAETSGDDSAKQAVLGVADPVDVGNQVKSYMQAGKYDLAAQTAIDFGQARPFDDDAFNKMLHQFWIPTLVNNAGAKQTALLTMINERGDTNAQLELMSQADISD
jgi:hypothetical protein